jgi:homoserine kinase
MEQKEIKVFAPATVANVVCGYDVLGFALKEPGDEIVMRLTLDNEIKLVKIEGDGGRLPLNPQKNVATQVVQLYLQQLGIAQGVEIELYKKMPLNSGMGSSAASSVAALVAINELMEKKLNKMQLLPLAMMGEKLACGNAHADNVAPALLGGLTLVRSYQPLDVVSLPFPENLKVVVIHPHVDVPTGEARKMIKDRISLSAAVSQWGNIAGLVAGFCTKNTELIGRSMIDEIIEPVRAMLIPGFYELKKEALEAGAIGFGISGSGPSVFALCNENQNAEQIVNSIQNVLMQKGVSNESYITQICPEGASCVSIDNNWVS